MEWTQIISLVCNVIFGGGFIAAMVTLKSTKQKAAAEVDTLTIGNTKEIVELWREYAAEKTAADQQQIKTLTDKVGDFEKLANTLKTEIKKLTRAINEAKKCPVENCPALKSLQDVT